MTDDIGFDDLRRAFATAARTATLATTRSDGRPRLVPICFVLGPAWADGQPRLHSPLDEKPKRSADPHSLARVRDLLERPAATILVERWSEDWSRLGWLRLDVRADLLEPKPRGSVEHAAAVAALLAKYPQYASHRLEDRPILRFSVERAVSWGDLTAD